MSWRSEHKKNISTKTGNNVTRFESEYRLVQLVAIVLARTSSNHIPMRCYYLRTMGESYISLIAH